MKNKAVLQLISEKIEEYLDLNCLKTEEDDFEYINKIFIGISNNHLEELKKDPLSKMFCIRYTDEDYLNLGVWCTFTGIDVIVDDCYSEISVISK